jgi:hypothetical protein
VNLASSGQPGTFGQPGLEPELMGRPASSEPTGHVDGIADFGTRPGKNTTSGGLAKHGHEETGWTLRFAEIAPDDDKFKAQGLSAEGLEEPSEPPNRGLSGQDHREQGRLRPPAHGGEITEVATYQLCGDVFGLMVGQEMPMADNGIGGGQTTPVRCRQKGTIVTRTTWCLRAGGTEAGEHLVNQGGFSQSTHLVPGNVGEHGINQAC